MSIEKRYSQFSDLHALLSGQGYGNLPKLPSKKYFMSNADMDNRQKGLENMLRLLSERPDTCNSQAFCQFLQLDRFFPELFNMPKMILQKKLPEKREQVTAIEYIECYNIFVLGIQAAKGARLEFYAF